MILMLGAIVAIGPLTIDMYLPALPTIVDDLRTSETSAQLTLTGVLLGLSVGQLVVGPLSDAIGRRRPLLYGMALHVLASLLCLLAPNIGVLGGLRVVQGFGAAAATPETRSRTTAIATTLAAAAPKPWTTRSPPSTTMLGASRHSSDASTCSAMP